MVKVLENKLMQSDPDNNITVGRFTYGKPDILMFKSKDSLTIGSFCSIADNVTILMGGEHFSNRVSTYPFNLLFEDSGYPWHEYSKGDTVIGNDVWIGTQVIILSGIIIGDGAVIGAGSVITKDVDAYTIVAGNPAKKIKDRFKQKTKYMLLEIKWWNWEMSKIKSDIPLLNKELMMIEEVT